MPKKVIRYLYFPCLLCAMVFTFIMFYTNVQAAGKNINMTWYSNATNVGYWSTAPNTFFTNLSSSFNISSYVNTAVNKWTSAGISSNITTSTSNATIRYYGGTRAELNTAGFYYTTQMYGLTYWDSSSVVGTANTYLDVTQLTAASASMCSETNSSYREHVAIHEYGHALGWDGHSDSVKDVMYPLAELTNTTLSASDINQLTQVYNAMK